MRRKSAIRFSSRSEPPLPLAGEGRVGALSARAILRQCGDDLTRQNIKRQATSLRNVTSSLALPGMSINTSPTDYRINKQMQMMKFNSERWELFGPIIEDSGPAS